MIGQTDIVVEGEFRPSEGCGWWLQCAYLNVHSTLDRIILEQNRDCSKETGKLTLVSAAVAQFDAQISTFKPHRQAPDGTPYPSYRCLNPEAPPPGLLPACEEAGVIGALTGVMGSIQAIEVIKELLEIGDSLAGRVLIYDALATRFYTVRIPWDPENPLNGGKPTIRDLSSHRTAAVGSRQ